MNHVRANWIETFSSFVQFYPKLTTAIVFGTMAAAGRMVSARYAAIDELISDERATGFERPVSARRAGKKAAKRKTAGRNGHR
jgi:hypothetical protein